MKKIKLFIIIFGLVFGVCLFADVIRVSAQSAQEEETIFTEKVRQQLKKKKAEAKQEWGDNFIYVVAMGTHPLPGVKGSKANTKAHAIALAEETANTIAFRKLIEELKEVKVDSATLLVNEELQGSVVWREVEGYIKGSKEIEVKCGVEEDSAVCFVARGLMLFKEYPEKLEKKKVEKEPTPQATIGGYLCEKVRKYEEKLEEKIGYYKPTSREISSIPSSKREEKYTGIIIDARGLNGSCAIYPKIITKDGKIIYGAKSVNPDYAIEYGVAGWAKSIEKAKNNARVKGNPLVVKAVAVKGNYKADYVVDDEDAALILEADKKNNLLDECKVMFVLD